MIRYCSGTDVRIGDCVDLDGTPAMVVEIIETDEQLKTTGLPKPMVAFATDKWGEICQSPTDRGWDGVILLKRAT